MKHVMPKSSQRKPDTSNLVIALDAANSNSHPALRKPKAVWSARTKNLFPVEIAQRHRFMTALYAAAHVVAGTGLYVYHFIKATGVPL